MRRTWAASADTEVLRRALHIVVVEAGERTTSALVAVLLGEAFTVNRIVDVSDVVAAMHAATLDTPDAVLIDAHLRAASAIDICRALRHCTDVPMLVLASDAETAHRIDAADCGAAPCLIEPCQPADLIARLRQLIERVPPPQRLAWRLDRSARTVAIGWRVLDLTPTEFRLLEALLLSAGRTLSRETLLDGIQQERRDVCDRAIDIHVRSLRCKIAAVLPGRDCIISVYGAGYRLDA